MEFAWSPEQQQGYDDTLAATRARFGPRSESRFRRENWKALAELGVLGASVPAAHGGDGLGALDTARRFEAVGRGCTDTGLVFAGAAHLFACAMPIVEFGTPAQRDELLPALCSGDRVAANAMTEAGAGSDVAAIATIAEPDGSGFVLNGTKTYVSNGPVADVLVTYAVTEPSDGHLGTSAFVLDARTPGVEVGEPLDKLGMHGCPASAVSFTDCRVPANALLGRPGQGALVFQTSMAWERGCLFALYLGLQDRLVDQCVAHARARRQFGRRIAEFQAVAHRIADMKVRLESSRLLLYRACWAMDAGEHAVLPVALSKLAVSTAAVSAAASAVEIFGGRGYLAEYQVEAALRDAIGGTIFSGTSDIQRTLVAEALGL